MGPLSIGSFLDIANKFCFKRLRTSDCWDGRKMAQDMARNKRDRERAMAPFMAKRGTRWSPVFLHLFLAVLSGLSLAMAEMIHDW